MRAASETERRARAGSEVKVVGEHEERAPNAGLADDEAVATALRRIDDSWRGLIAALDGIPDERLAEPGVAGEWSIKDVMGHVAFWDEQAVIAARRHLAGEPPRQVDWQAVNKREAAARAGRSAAEQRAEMERAHEAVVTLLRTTPPTDPNAVGLCGCLEGDTYQHYDKHAADIRAWRERVGV